MLRAGARQWSRAGRGGWCGRPSVGTTVTLLHDIRRQSQNEVVRPDQRCCLVRETDSRSVSDITIPSGSLDPLGDGCLGLTVKKRQSPILAQPEVDEGDDPDDRDYDVPDDAAEGVERGVQEGDAGVRDHDGQCGSKTTVARAMEDHAAEDRRPQSVAEWSQHSANELLNDE